MMYSSRRLLMSILILNLQNQFSFVSSSKCSGALFVCPNDNSFTEDCLDCSGLPVPDVDSSTCIERDVFISSEFLINDIFGLIVWFLAAGLAISVGVGGGGIFVPLGLILLRFGAKPATGLSQASIFGASIAGLILNLKAPHPNNPRRGLIDLDTALFLAPLQMAGAVLGVIVQRLLPVWAVILIMVVVLGYTSYRTILKGKETYQKEKDKLKKLKEKTVETVQRASVRVSQSLQLGRRSSLKRNSKNENNNMTAIGMSSSGTIIIKEETLNENDADGFNESENVNEQAQIKAKQAARQSIAMSQPVPDSELVAEGTHRMPLPKAPKHYVSQNDATSLNNVNIKFMNGSNAQSLPPDSPKSSSVPDSDNKLSTIGEKGESQIGFTPQSRSLLDVNICPSSKSGAGANDREENFDVDSEKVSSVTGGHEHIFITRNVSNLTGAPSSTTEKFSPSRDQTFGHGGLNDQEFQVSSDSIYNNVNNNEFQSNNHNNDNVPSDFDNIRTGSMAECGPWPPSKPSVNSESYDPERPTAISQAKGSVYTVGEWKLLDEAFPLKQYGYLIILWIFLISILLIRGGKGMDSLVGIEFCGIGYWSTTGVAFLWLFSFGALMGRRAVFKVERKLQVNYPFEEGDVLWDREKLLFYGRWTFLAGIIAGLIGIGGGMVLGPLMIQMGVLPQVAAATNATMIALTSSSAAFIFISTGQVPVSYALVFMFCTFSGGLLGKKQIDGYVKKKGLASILIFILAGIITFATVMVSIAGVIRYADQDWCFEGIQKICD